MARNKTEETEVIEVDETEETEEVHKPITPADIADATGADPKAIRGWLRANHARPKDMKGKSWDIKPDVAEKALAHFTPSEDEDEEVVDLDELEGIEA